MKYIRTEDGIYRTDTDKEELVSECLCTYVNGHLYPIHVEDRLANTIEDLIDTLVVCFDNNIQPVLCGYSKFQSKLYAGDRGHIMGAIWTDKGLVYVAKMNDKGELELL